MFAGTVSNKASAHLSSIPEERAEGSEFSEIQQGGLDGGNEPIDLETGLHGGQSSNIEIASVALDSVEETAPLLRTAANRSGGFQEFGKKLSATCTQAATSVATFTAAAAFVGLRSTVGSLSRTADIFASEGKELAARSNSRDVLGPSYCAIRLDKRLPNLQKTMAFLDALFLAGLVMDVPRWTGVGALSSLFYAYNDFSPERQRLTNWLAGKTNPSTTVNPAVPASELTQLAHATV